MKGEGVTFGWRKGFYFILERWEGREKEKERNANVREKH